MPDECYTELHFSVLSVNQGKMYDINFLHRKKMEKNLIKLKFFTFSWGQQTTI